MLKIKEQDRFFGSTFIDFADGEQELDAPQIENIKNLRFQLHEVIENEDLTRIAYTYYQNLDKDASKFWWLIALANDIDNPLDVSDLVGQQIRIPDLAQFILVRNI